MDQATIPYGYQYIASESGIWVNIQLRGFLIYFFRKNQHLETKPFDEAYENRTLDEHFFQLAKILTHNMVSMATGSTL